MELHNPQVTRTALEILRNPSTFQWYVIPLLAIVVYIYATEIQDRRWPVIAAGLALYSVHWFYEILNALIQHFSGHALWTVPAGTAFLLLIGVGVEISLMFSIAGLVMSKLLPADPRLKIFGINNRIVLAIINAALFSLIEIFLVQTPTFAWVYPWWGVLPVFVLVYIPFFLAANLAHDWKPQVQIRFIGGLFGLDALMLGVFGALLGWI